MGATTTRLGAQDTDVIRGRVTGADSLPIPDARVAVTSISGNVTRSARTGQDGRYTVTFPGGDGDYIATPLRIGTYTVSVDLQGFKKATRSNLVLRVQDRLRVDFQLEVGDMSEAVVVTGEAPLIQTETSSMGEVIDSRQIQSLPLNGRNYLDLATLTVGVTRTDAGTNGNVGGLGSTGLPSSFPSSSAV